MPKSKNSKLYPLFCQPSKSSVIDSIDVIDISDGSSDEDDDLPLTFLLDSKNEAPPPRKNNHNLSKEKREKKRHVSTVTPSAGNAKRKNPGLTERKNQKQAKISNEPGKASILHGASIAQKNEASMTKHESFNESVSDGNVEGIIVNGNDSGLSSKTTRKTAHDKIINQLRQGRLYSDSSMDFIAPNLSQSELDQRSAQQIRNVVHKLNRRITNGGCLSQHRHKRHFSPCSKARIIQNKKSSISSSYCLPKIWKIPSWISLEQPSMETGVSDSKNIDHIRWDPMGVLLAVAIDRSIIIYDWDMLRAADLQGRRDRVRGCNESEFKIPPIVKFRLPHPVASLVWNPFDIDELAVGFR